MDAKEGYPHFDKKELSEIYNRICKEGFRTDTQKIDVIFQRLGAFYDYKRVMDESMIFDGQLFLKFGRRGKPHNRLIYMDKDCVNIIWCIRDDNKVESRVRRIKTADIFEVRVGVNASTVLKKHALPV